MTLVFTRIFFVCKSRLITSRTVVFLIELVPESSASGVYPVIKKWHLGVGTSEATRPIRSLFM